MQRWIYFGIVACLVIGGGMGFFLMQMRSNRPDSRWVPIAIREGVSAEQKAGIVAEIEKYVKKDQTMTEVVADVKLQTLLGMANADEAKAWLLQNAFVRLGKQIDSASMKELETIDVGVNGKRKDLEVLNATATHLGDKVRRMLDQSAK